MESLLLSYKGDAHEEPIWGLHVGEIKGDHWNTSAITAGYDGAIKIWDTKNFELVEKKCLLGHGLGVMSAVLNREGTLIGSSGMDSSLRLWDAVTGEPKAPCVELAHMDTCNTAFTADSKYLVIGSHEGKITLYNTSDLKQERQMITQNRPLNTVAVCPNGKYIATSDVNGKIHLFDYATGQRLYGMIAHYDMIREMAFSPDSKVIMTASDDKLIRLFDIRCKRLIYSIIGHTDWVLSCAFSRNGELIASGSKDKTVSIWDARSRACLATQFHEDQIWAVRFLPCDEKMVTASEDGSIKLFHLKEKKAFAPLMDKKKLRSR